MKLFLLDTLIIWQQLDHPLLSAALQPAPICVNVLDGTASFGFWHPATVASALTTPGVLA